MIQRLPEPPRLFLATDKGPHFVQLSFLHLANDHHGFYSLTRCHEGGVYLVELGRFFLSVVNTVVGLTPSTRAVSRMPLPLSAMSPICRLTSGSHPVL